MNTAEQISLKVSALSHSILNVSGFLEKMIFFRKKNTIGKMSTCLQHRGVATDFRVWGRRVAGWPTYPKIPQKIEKKHQILATSFSNLGGVDRPGFQKCGGQDPPEPPSATPLLQQTIMSGPRPDFDQWEPSCASWGFECCVCALPWRRESERVMRRL